MFRVVFHHYQELITLYLQYLALMRPVLLPVPFNHVHDMYQYRAHQCQIL